MGDDRHTIVAERLLDIERGGAVEAIAADAQEPIGVTQIVFGS
jgi:hypothetical protein